MLIIAAGQCLLAAFNRQGARPFPRVPASGSTRTILLASYNDIAAQTPGHTETTRVMVDVHKNGRADVCFGPDFESATRSRACPPGRVIEGLATGVYEQFLWLQGIAPEHVAFHDYIPAYTFKGPTFFESVEQPALWRPAPLHWTGARYDLAPQPRPANLIDPTLSRKVPKALLALQSLPASHQLDLSAYTPPASRQLVSAAVS